LVAGPIAMAWPRVLPKWVLERIEGLSSSAQVGALVLAVLSFGAVTLLHYLLLSLFTPGNGRAASLKSHA
ncbi:MAG: hypothetical protein ACLQVI_07530, partial [Polyangiaceae bacterium]